MKTFNINADCNPEFHYMVDLTDRLKAIRAMVDRGEYFTINRARQYGKTTILQALERFLADDYTVVNMDFQLFGSADFETESSFVNAFAEELLDIMSGSEDFPDETARMLHSLLSGSAADRRLSRLFRCLSQWCGLSDRKIVLMIDEVDSAANNQVFMDCLAQLRGYYIQRHKKPAFHSVILAGVYDVKNMKRKFVSEDTHKVNSPWNIAADFLVDMDFSADDIAGMLTEYENDHLTNMDIRAVAGLLYDYTAGYPFLVSKLCKLMDERPGALSAQANVWTREGVLTAVRILLLEKNTLFESLIRNLQSYPELKSILYALLFLGQTIAYNPDDSIIDIALMFGFVKIENESIVIANRIFETRIYNYFLTATEMQNMDIYKAGLKSRNQFTEGGQLNMRLVLEKFVIHFDELYGDRDQTFLEEDGRRFFLLYLKPIINGTGNYYIEAQTRNMERTDVIVDYHGEQFIIELKIWRGNAYHTRGEAQLTAYLDYYHLKKGYMLSFNFNQKKQIGVHDIILGSRILTEAVV